MLGASADSHQLLDSGCQFWLKYLPNMVHVELLANICLLSTLPLRRSRRCHSPVSNAGLSRLAGVQKQNHKLFLVLASRAPKPPNRPAVGGTGREKCLNGVTFGVRKSRNTNSRPARQENLTSKLTLARLSAPEPRRHKMDMTRRRPPVRRCATLVNRKRPGPRTTRAAQATLFHLTRSQLASAIS